MNENKKGVLAKKHKVASLEPSKPRNFVAKNAINSGAGVHKDKKKAMKQGDTKHKKLDYAESLELQLNQKLKENKLDEFLPALGAMAGRALVGAEAGAVARAVGMGAGRVAGNMASDALDDKETDEEFNGEYDDEAGMAHGNLHTIARAAQGLIKEIEENDNLPEWCQEKIAVSKSMIVTVWDYIISEKEQGIDPKVSEGGYRHGFADPTAPRLGRRGRDDDEYHVPDPVEPQYNIKVNGEVINRQPFANRAEALAWAKQAVAAGKLDPKIAKLSPIQGMAEGLHPMVIDDIKKLATLNPADRYSAYGNIRGYFKADPELIKMASALQGGYYEADMLRGKYKTDAAKAKYAELEPMHRAFIKQALGQEQGVAEGYAINESSDVLAGLTDILKIAASRQAPQNPRYFAQQVKDVALQLKDNPATQKWSNYLDGVVRWADVISSGKEQYSSGFADEVHNVLGPATRAYQDAVLNKQGTAEGWSQKYKNSINCSHPKGFSQRAHCQGKKKHNEDMSMEMTCPDCGMCETHGNLHEIKKGSKDSNGYTSCWKGYHAAGTKKGKNGGRVRNCVPNESSDDPWGPQGRYVGDAGPKNISTEVPKVRLEIGDQVIYRPTEQRATIEALSKDGTQARIHIGSPMGGKYFNCRVSDLKAIGRGVAEGAKVDRQAMHITKSMMKAHPGMSHDQAEAAAWAHIKHPKKKKKKAAEGWTTDTLAAQLFEQEITYEDKLNSMLTKKLSK
jgi:hypothetical protein